VLVAGGIDAAYAAQSTCWIFDPETDAWSAAPSLSASRTLHSITRLNDGTVLVAGGGAGVSTPPLQTAERFNPETGTAGEWSPAGTMVTARRGHSATLLRDGRVLVAGGWSVRSGQSSGTLRSAEIYNPADNTWTATINEMTDERSGHQAVLLPDSRVLVMGGTKDTGHGTYTGLAFCEIFNPATETWAPTGDMANPRWNHTASVLPDGTVLAAGGGGFLTLVADWVATPHGDWTAERYNPATGRWVKDADMANPRVWHQAVPLASGKVLVTGGGAPPYMNAGFQSTALYDPLAHSWSPATGMHTGRWAHLAIRLADGRVLVAGGVDRPGPNGAAYHATTTTEIFTPAQGLG
jgi:hypothetical protein